MIAAEPQRSIRGTIHPEDTFTGEAAALRLIRLEDCTSTYVAWLNDPQVNRYLETRWHKQDIEAVRSFVARMIASPADQLFAILDLASGRHVGNLKIGPIVDPHGYADISYFIGYRGAWGRGLATDAIRIACRIGFDVLGLHRLQAGVYSGNPASARALEKAGFSFEGTLRQQLIGPEGREDLLWYGLVQQAIKKRSAFPSVEE